MSRAFRWIDDRVHPLVLIFAVLLVVLGAMTAWIYWVCILLMAGSVVPALALLVVGAAAALAALLWWGS
jgi:hypothetical protein